MAQYPNPIENRKELNLRLGIKSSLYNLRSVVASLYSMYVAMGKPSHIDYTEEVSSNGVITLKMHSSIKSAIVGYFNDSTISDKIEASPLFKAQIESLQVGLELFFHLAKVSFNKQGLSERIGSNRYNKCLDFSTNVLQLDLLFSSFPDSEVKAFLSSWIAETACNTELEKKVLLMLSVFSEDTQCKIRTKEGNEVYFQREGIYKLLTNGESVVSEDAKELVGPYRILKSYVSSGMHPFLREKNREFQSTTDKDVLSTYAEMVSTMLDISPRRQMIVQEEIAVQSDDSFIRNSDHPLQQIFYGAPGTGKSYKVNELTKGDDTVIRTTFHPDSDYASFVGCYKPVTKEDKPLMQVVADFATRQAISIPVLDSAGNTVYDTSITYQFTQQAFLKAYIQAWKKLCKNNHSAAASSITTVVPPVGSVSLSFPVNSITYTIIEVTSDYIRIKREFDLAKNRIKNVWDSLWTSGDFTIPRGRQSGRSVEIAVCRWIYEKLDDATKDSFDDGWTLLIDTLNSGEVYVSVADSKSSQVYTVTKIEDNDASVHISNVASSKRARLKKCFEGTNPDGVEIGLIDVLRRINSENFDDAWNGLTEKIEKGENEYSDIQDVELIENKEEDGLITDPQYLVIEEINRGNCAQIFGDIFQLLDRNEAGFSTYPIVPDADITRELKTVFASLDLSSVENYINGIFSENYPGGIVDKIKSGELLVLPCNLNLLATMNTSDQSLFPMDSAFKRRWDWEYVSIRYIAAEEKDDKDNFHTFTITIDDKHHYLWTDFLQKVNAKILSVTDSEDKQMGEYFIKKSINQNEFINKVMYYLWSEVGKDNFNSTNNALFVLPDGLIKETKDGKEEDKKEFSFNELFKDNATELLIGFMKKLEVKSEEEKAAEKAATSATPTEV